MATTNYSMDDVVIVACPLCGSENRDLLCTEFGVLGVVRCRGCSLIYISPRLKNPEHVYWGDEQGYLNEIELILDGRNTHHRDPNYLEELELIRSYKPSGRFLDVGCSTGMLLRHAKRLGFEGIGVDPSPTLSKIAREHLGNKVYNCFLHELPEGEIASFDVIALSDVFEHITNPIQFLKTVAIFLKPDGILYVKVPNGQWNLFKQKLISLLNKNHTTNSTWDSYEHVVHYTDKTLPTMLKKCGFTPLTITIGKPIQTPVWHEYIGKYYQYPSPISLDLKRHMGRSLFYWASLAQKSLLGSCGPFAPNLAAVAKLSA
jgi:2-polyprenyl-3-methyl-5-hydroxy-6-metoxy-1,4-benzoquinol methylase